jgi:hypothetical protein
MFDKRLRDKLADPNLLPPALVGQASASIKLQHTLSLLLYKRALQGRPTYIAREQYLRNIQEIINALKQILNELNEELLAFNDEVGLFDKDAAKSQINELRTLFSTALNGLENVEENDFSQEKKRWDELLSNVEKKFSIIRQTLKQVEDLEVMFEKIPDLDKSVLNELKSLRNLLLRARNLCIGLLNAAQSSYRTGDGGLIQTWYKANSSNIEMVAEGNFAADELLSRLFTPLNTYLITKMKNNYEEFRKKFGFGFEEITTVIMAIARSFGSLSANGLARFLKEFPNTAQLLCSVNLPGLIAYESLNRIKNELKVKPEGVDIIDAINLLLWNKIRFSLMLEPPSPELALAGVEEA